MKAIVAFFTVIALGASMAAAQISSDNCKTVELKKGESAPSGSSSMSTSITAGNGKVSGTTTGPGGTVTHSGGSGSFSTSTASDGKSTVVTDSNGKCTVYRRTE